MAGDNRLVKRWREKTKLKLVTALGGKCIKCGYFQCAEALDFHHRDEHEKDFSVSKGLTNPKKWNDLILEVKKCVLLCCRCHRELHAGIWQLNSLVVPEPVGLDPIVHKKDLTTGVCPICGKDVYGTITCSRSCAAIKTAKAEWPDKEELALLLESHSKAEIGDMLGVSEAAVRKREIKYWGKPRKRKQT